MPSRFLLTCYFLSFCPATQAFTTKIVGRSNPKLTIRHAGKGERLDEEADESGRREFLRITGALGFAAASGSSLVLPSGAEDLALSQSTASAVGSIELPPMGLGAWAWGDSLFWGYNQKNDGELKEVFDYAVSNSKYSSTFFDTAELYGLGRSEKLLGEFSKSYDPEKVTIASKFAALPFRTKPQDVVKACEASVKRLGRPVDLYQIHFPNAWSNAEYWDGVAMAYEKGLVKSVGVSNYGVDAIRSCHAVLAERGIPLATNQIQYSLLYTWPEKNGLLETCRELGVEVLSYSPLALGMLTGKYTKDNMPSGPRQKIFEQLIETDDYENLLSTMREVAKTKDGATLAQVAINWTRAKGTIPIPGARTLKQVQQNYGALDWNLSNEEVALLDEAAAKVNTFITPDKSPFPKKDINTGLVMFDS